VSVPVPPQASTRLARAVSMLPSPPMLIVSSPPLPNATVSMLAGVPSTEMVSALLPP
jgi:hypothetical protein